MHRLGAALVLLLTTLSLTSLGTAATASTALRAPATTVMGDPAVGPHARAEAGHKNDRVTAPAPASGPIIARRAARAPAVSSAAGSSSTLASGAGTLNREVLGFAPHWAIRNGQQTSWNYTLMTTLAYFGLPFNADGSFNTSDDGYVQFNSANFQDMENRAHSAGDRVVLVTTAMNNSLICSIVYNSATAAIHNTVAQMQAKGLDGVNVDFEGQNTTCPNGQSLQAGLTGYMAQLKAALPQSYVTIDTYSGAASWDSGEFRIEALAPNVDGIFVMAYDMSFSNMPAGGAQAGPNAPLNGWTYNDTLAVSQYLTKAPASKIILGVPYYGYKWCTVDNSPYAAATRNSTGKVICPDGASTPTADSYSQAQADFGCALQLAKGWDSTASSPWASWYSPATNDPCLAPQPGHNSWRELYYDDPTSIGLKYDLVNANNLAGSGMWALGDEGSTPDLWNVIAQKFVYWKNWVPLGGSLSTGPAVASQGTGKLDVFAAGRDQALYQRSFDGTSWGPWQRLGGQLTAEPAAVSWGSGRIDVFARGVDKALYQRTYEGGTWHYWVRIAASMSSGPAVSSSGPNHLDVFGAGSDNQLYHKVFNGTSWSDWQALGGKLSSAPGAVSSSTGQIDVVARGLDSALYHKSFNGTIWGGWEYLGGSLSTGASISSRGSAQLDVFAAGQNAVLYHKVFDGTSWSPWQWLGGRLNATPASVSWASNRIDVFARSVDNALYQKVYQSP